MIGGVGRFILFGGDKDEFYCVILERSKEYFWAAYHEDVCPRIVNTFVVEMGSSNAIQ